LLKEGDPMRFELPVVSRAWGKYVGELVIVAVGVALGLAATQWAEDRQVRSQLNDAYDVLSDELGDNLQAVRYRQAVRPCVRRRIADLRGWIERQSRGVGGPLPADLGNPGALIVLDSVWDVSKSGQVVAKMPLEVRRRYAAVYDLFETVATLQRAERDVWFSLGDHAGLSQMTPLERARFNGLVSRAEIYDELLSSTFPTIVNDLARLKVEPPSSTPNIAGIRRRAICQLFTS
jgi:hypothetical protein